MPGTGCEKRPGSAPGGSAPSCAITTQPCAALDECTPASPMCCRTRCTQTDSGASCRFVLASARRHASLVTVEVAKVTLTHSVSHHRRVKSGVLCNAKPASLDNEASLARGATAAKHRAQPLRLYPKASVRARHCVLHVAVEQAWAQQARQRKRAALSVCVSRDSASVALRGRRPPLPSMACSYKLSSSARARAHACQHGRALRGRGRPRAGRRTVAVRADANDSIDFSLVRGPIHGMADVQQSFPFLAARRSHSGHGLPIQIVAHSAPQPGTFCVTDEVTAAILARTA